MIKESKAMKEIHEIRERIYIDTKKMASEDRASLTRKESKEMIDKHGLIIKRPDHVNGGTE